jgi:hypothetical protein
LQDQAVQVVTVASISAVFTCHTGSTVPAVAENLLRHERVVESFMGDPDRALLPARFATMFRTSSDLDAILQRHRATLIAGLEKVRGCVELGLRVLNRSPTLPPAPPVAAASGREYMMARLADEQARRGSQLHAAQVAAAMNQVLGPLARDVVQRNGGDASLVLSGAYLVSRSRTDDFSARVCELAAAHPSLQLLCTGPWPAYHFAPSVPFAEAPHE